MALPCIRFRVLVHARVCAVKSVQVLLREFCRAARANKVPLLPALQQRDLQLVGETASGQQEVVQQQPASLVQLLIRARLTMPKRSPTSIMRTPFQTMPQMVTGCTAFLAIEGQSAGMILTRSL